MGMKKQPIIIGIIVLLVSVGLNGCATQNNSFRFALSPNLNGQCVGIEYWVYNNVSNWKYIDPIEYQSILIGGGYSRPIPQSNIYLIRIRYVTYVDSDNTGMGCTKCSFPEEIYNKIFQGTFTTGETFTIQSTGYITKSDGSLLSESLL
jgi:hypothetical protein